MPLPSIQLEEERVGIPCNPYHGVHQTSVPSDPYECILNYEVRVLTLQLAIEVREVVDDYQSRKHRQAENKDPHRDNNDQVEGDTEEVKIVQELWAQQRGGKRSVHVPST